MCDFFACFPAPGRNAATAVFDLISEAVLTGQKADDVTRHLMPRCQLLVSRSGANEPFLHMNPRKDFVLVSKGIMFDCAADQPAVDPSRVQSALQQNDIAALLRYEGTFACCAWDETAGRGFLFNDQVSQLNLYYMENSDGVYASSNALCLARSLHLGLDPRGAAEFFALGLVYAPDSMFEGLKRLSTGEFLTIEDGRLTKEKAWQPCGQGAPVKVRADAIEGVVTMIKDRCGRYYRAAPDTRIVCDITGGYDSRLLAAACLNLGCDFGLTVNGLPDLGDVRIAHKIADTCGLELRYFDTTGVLPADIEQDLKIQLLYLTNGELPFNEIYRHYLSRPVLAKDFDIHFNGSGGELFRYYPWSQEFFGIGRRKLASVDRALRYRYVPKKMPRMELFRHNWYPDFENRLRAHLSNIFLTLPDSLTTQQLDAAYVWKKTGMPTVYLSSHQNWLPSVCPFLTAGVVEAAVSLPWTFRLTSRFQRELIQALSPDLARLETEYGGVGAPASIGTIYSESKQVANRARKLFGKLDAMILGGRLTRSLSRPTEDEYSAQLPIPPLFQNLLRPGHMRSAQLYDPETFRSMVEISRSDVSWPRPLVERVATIELLCRELEFEPDGDFFASG